MPIRPPALDDRGYDDLVAELLARVPAHTPEWTNPRPGDPGRTLIELFAWLADTVLYRANLVPERQRLAFLRLLGVPLRPAQAARGMVALAEPRPAAAVQLRALATLKGPVSFETRGEVTVLPVEAQAYYKRALGERERRELAPLLEELKGLYGVGGNEEVVGYVTTPVFPGGAPDPAGFDLVEASVDATLWVALLAPETLTPEEVRRALGSQQILNVGVAPAVEVPGLGERVGPQGGVPVVWEISTPRTLDDRMPEYLQLDVLHDETRELTRRGVVRLGLPGPDDIGAPGNRVGDDVEAGSRGRPPRLDAPATAARLVAWLRMRPARLVESLSLTWIGVNVVEVDQRQSLFGRVVGESDGTADQTFQLPGASVEAETLLLEVEDPERGFLPWLRVDDLATAGRDDAAFQLDAEAGTVRFGDGMRGAVPRQGMRVRVALMRAGGGLAGNLPAGTLTRLAGTRQDGVAATLNAVQPLPMEGGDDAETLAEAERRIPALLRDRNRAVTPDDYRHLAAEAPGVRAGRVEVLPRFKPQQRRPDVPGVVSVMVLPRKELRQAPNPRPDRPLLERVHAHLDALRPVTTELYVIGVEYVALGVATSISVAEGHGRDTVTQAVREALRAYLWPLAPGGPAGTGWPLDRDVSDRELEVAVARVPGVSAVVGVNLFRRDRLRWRLVPRPGGGGAEVRLPIRAWQLPELLSVVVVADGGAVPAALDGVPDPFAGRRAGAGRGRRVVDVPVVPEVC